jgi:hypothetical protein
MKNLGDTIVYIEDCRCPYTAFETRTIAENLDWVGAFYVLDFLQRLFFGAANETFKGFRIAWATSDCGDGFYPIGRDVSKVEEIV